MLNPNLKLMGLHTHIGTYIMSTDAYRIAATKLADLAYSIARNLIITFRILIWAVALLRKYASGGIAFGEDTTPSFDEYAEAITSAIIDSRIKPDKLPSLITRNGSGSDCKCWLHCRNSTGQ
jgi:diaminopimelate decarboxylase